MIHFSLDGEHYEQSLLNEVYDGVFVKEFVLFFGESVLYYMTEQVKGGGEDNGKCLLKLPKCTGRRISWKV